MQGVNLAWQCQSCLKNFNWDWPFQSRPSEFPTKIGPWWVRGFAKGVGRKGFPWFVLIWSENKSEENRANRNKSGYSRKQGTQIGTNRKKTGKSEQIGVTPFCRPQIGGSDEWLAWNFQSRREILRKFSISGPLVKGWLRVGAQKGGFENALFNLKKPRKHPDFLYIK